ncbi:glutamate--tRNA ligase [Faecalicoccus pleomorphus]|uniref:glutamate--tRNA ligase n=1 Tax=Faecalicoccus pleomorphus TaxID=1323 RepID=UPI0014316A4C|nr:glutamate--tRNA ligase [Faecalicoccus pleomorphus]MBM6678875.1 glutamate--tRNA ligase [Faecalicoccus pleomorphus]NJE39784.1 glutamate--tRNA ligase [Faecalicoccus pleomorphus]
MAKIRTRFAPSPTGYMHIGNLRTALFEYLIAKHEDGDFILRIEDTDQNRQVEGAVDIIYKTMKDCGLNWDEGPDIGGEHGPYVQSERLGMYKGYAEELIRLGGAHYCFCSEEELQRQREEQGDSFKFDDPCKHLTPEEVQAKLDAGVPYVIRQTIGEIKETTFDDEVYGHIEVDVDTLDEQVLIKSDGFPTYNFANIIDDHQMEITHVVRGNEYLSSTPKYNLIYDAYGWKRPIYVHVPPVMKDEHHKLSKRNGDASFQDLVAKGYLPEAIINYIALLGWSPQTEQEIYTMDELIQVFDIHRISKRPAIFDIDKLTWMNGEYLKHMDFDCYYELVLPYLKNAIHSDIDLKEIAKLVQSRANTLNEIEEMIDFFDALPDYDVEMFKHKRQKSKKETAVIALKEAYEALSSCDWSSEEKIHDLLMALPERLEMKNGQVLWPVRTALTGKQSTPGGAIEVAYILGKDESLRRIQTGIEKLEKDLESAA